MVSKGQKHELYPSELLTPDFYSLYESEVTIDNVKMMEMFNVHAKKRYKITDQEIQTLSRVTAYKNVWPGLGLPFSNHLRAAKESRLCSCYLNVLVPYSSSEEDTSSNAFAYWKFCLRTEDDEYIPMTPIHWKSMLIPHKTVLEKCRKFMYKGTNEEIANIELCHQTHTKSYWLPSIYLIGGFSEKILKARGFEFQ
jgi:hypothetical protein